MSRVFLGGTCNGSTWRDDLIVMLEAADIDYFNPVVDDWTEEAYQTEMRERERCDFVLYAITAAMSGVYSIAEVVDDSNKRPEKTIFIVIEEGFDKGQLNSLSAVKRMIADNSGFVCSEFGDVITYITKEEENNNV